MGYDVVIVGASLAGCSAAIHYGRAGLRVALLERSRSMDAFKGMCGHFVLGGTRPALERLGLWDAMVARGAAVSDIALWSGSGWIQPTADVPPAISLRRRHLDPMLRQMAASTPGVDLHLGHTVTGLLQAGNSLTGVVARHEEGVRSIEASLVVAADGHRSPVAELAGVEAKIGDNARFLYWGYYSGVRLRSPASAAVWNVDPHVAVAIPTDDGLHLLGVFATKDRLDDFADDKLTAVETFFAELPDGPDLSGAERASKAVGTSDYPMVRRKVNPRPGLALIGDAATTSDPVPAVGCGWAFRSAEWLAGSTIPALRGEESLRTGLKRYARSFRFIVGHDRLIRSEARGREANPIQRALRTAARHDEVVASRLGNFAMRAIPVSGLLNPAVIGRALVGARRGDRSQGFVTVGMRQQAERH